MICQVCSLLANVFTLFIGLMLIITDFLENQAKSAGETVDNTQRNVISFIVFLANMVVLGLPALQSLASENLSGRVASAAKSCRGLTHKKGASKSAILPPQTLGEPSTVGENRLQGDLAFTKVHPSPQICCWWEGSFA